MIKLFTTIGFLLCFSLPSWAQQSYFVFFKDKDNSHFSIDKPEEFLTQRSITRRQKQGITITERDLPVNEVYVQEIITQGAKVIYTSKWLNAVIIETDITTLAAVEALPYVDKKQGLTFNNIAYPQHSSKSAIAATNSEEKETFYSTIPYNILDIKEQKGIEEDYGASATQNVMIGIDASYLKDALCTGKLAAFGIGMSSDIAIAWDEAFSGNDVDSINTSDISVVFITLARGNLSLEDFGLLLKLIKFRIPENCESVAGAVIEPSLNEMYQVSVIFIGPELY